VTGSARCFLFLAETDQALRRRDAQATDSGVSGRVYSMMAEEMSDTRNRGRIVWILASSRPDLIVVDLKRPGADRREIPLFPTATPSESFALRQALCRLQASRAPRGARFPNRPRRARGERRRVRSDRVSRPSLTLCFGWRRARPKPGMMAPKIPVDAVGTMTAKIASWRVAPRPSVVAPAEAAQPTCRESGRTSCARCSSGVDPNAHFTASSRKIRRAETSRCWNRSPVRQDLATPCATTISPSSAPGPRDNAPRFKRRSSASELSRSRSATWLAARKSTRARSRPRLCARLPCTSRAGASLFGESYRVKRSITVSDLISVSRQVIHNELDVIRDAFDRNGIDLLWGRAEFLEPKMLLVSRTGESDRITADRSSSIKRTAPFGGCTRSAPALPSSSTSARRS
jgi:hypothetical protein